LWKANEEWLYRGMQGQGGHWLNQHVIVRRITYPPRYNSVSYLPENVPYKAIIDIKSLKGKTFPKLQESSMFPRNWSLERIRQEVAFVYENTVAKGKGLNPESVTKKFKQYKFKNSSNNFDILIEVDDLDNIMNAYPLI
jgi:hypothetical protein